MKQTSLVVAAAVAFSMSAGATEPESPVTVQITRLSMDIAMKLAKAGIDACRKQGVNVAITVVDRGGHPQVVLRDTLAMDLALPISRQKAYTAMTFNTPTSQLEGRFPSAYSVPKVDRLLGAESGLADHLSRRVADYRWRFDHWRDRRERRTDRHPGRELREGRH